MRQDRKNETPLEKDDRQAYACFGFRKVKAEEKAGLVLRHFDSIARKYDFMNTLLSFGIHHLWKRTAVKMLSLKSGDRVLDVCGGTADLAILAARTIGPSGSVVLYDFNRDMMEAGRSKVERASPAGHIQSLLLAVILIVVGVQVWVVGVVADLIAVNRRLLEEIVEEQRKNAADRDR